MTDCNYPIHCSTCRRQIVWIGPDGYCDCRRVIGFNFASELVVKDEGPELDDTNCVGSWIGDKP